MSQKFNPYPIKVAKGGSLVTVPSVENIGEENFREKVNWRRVSVDRESLREGDVVFTPSPDFTRLAQVLSLPAGITLMAEAVRPNGSKSIVAASKTTIYRYRYATGDWQQIGSGYSANGRRWQTEDNNGWLCFNNAVDLPFTFRVEDNAVVPMYELREIGIASVGRISVSNGMLILMDLTEIQSGQLAGIMNGGSPYGLVAANLTNRIQYKMLWSEIGGPTNYAPILAGTMAAAGNSILLTFPTNTIKVGDKIGVKLAGPSGGLLGGQSGVDTGIPVTAVSVDRKTITWDPAYPSDAGAGYPLATTIARFADFSSIVGTYTLQDDSSRIINGKQLGRNRIAVYRESGVFTGRFTGDKTSPWAWEKTRKTENIPKFDNAIVNPTGEQHIYASKGSFYIFDGSSDPYIHKEMELSKDQFFAGLDFVGNADDVYAFDNSISQEIWWCRPAKTYVWDYRFNKCGTIDAAYTAAAIVHFPNTELKIAVMGRAGVVMKYGLDESNANRIFYRETYSAAAGGSIVQRGYTARILFGYTALGDEFSEKMLRTYVINLVSSRPQVEVFVTLMSASHPSGDLRLLFRRLVSDIRKNMIPAHFQRTFFSDKFEVTTTNNTSFQGIDFTGRIYEFARVNSKAITKT